MTSKFTLIATILGFIFFQTIDASTVPVIGWSNTRNLFSTRPISAGEEISPESLKNDFLDKGLGSDPQTVVLVLLNKLSLGDLTKYANAYGSDGQGGVIPNIKNSMDMATSTLVVPQTETSELVEDLVSKVMGQQGEVTEVSNTAELKNFQINPSKSNLIIVRIEPSDSMEEQLTTADSYIKTAMKLINGKTPQQDFTVFFTAVKTSKLSSKSSGRHLLQENEETKPAVTAAASSFLFIDYTNAGCKAYVYAKTTTAKLMNKKEEVKKLLLPTEGWTTEGSTCPSNTSFVLKFGVSGIQENGTGAWISSVSISMTFVQSDGWWNVNSTKLSYQLKGEGMKEEEIVLPNKLETPLDWSYHCGDIDLAETNITGESLTLSFYDYQVQPFNIKENKFSSANECVGFFTSTIWMGLIVALLVIVIIAFGISMMAAVRVMDKFDDPKGKQLVINVPES